MRALLLIAAIAALPAVAGTPGDQPRMRCAACSLLPAGSTGADLTLSGTMTADRYVSTGTTGTAAYTFAAGPTYFLKKSGVSYGLWDNSGSMNFDVATGTTALTLSSTTATFNGTVSSGSGSGSDAFKVTTSGARYHFGTGANDYASSDGTTVTFAGPVTVGGLSAAAGSFTVNSVSGTSAISSGNALAFASKAVINTAPTLPVACTSPTIAASNGTAAFKIGVGSACATGTVSWTMPAATTGWSCSCENQVTDRQLHCKSTSTTAVSCVQYTVAGVAQNFAASDTLECGCTGY
jgi:hypothetical protein